MGNAKKLFIGNYKGGVGKTTSIYQLALHMTEAGRKVLVIDLDPQCSLSEICLARNDRTLDELRETECLNYVFEMWHERKKFPSLQLEVKAMDMIKTTPEGMDYIPSNLFYRGGGLDEFIDAANQ